MNGLKGEAGMNPDGTRFQSLLNRLIRFKEQPWVRRTMLLTLPHWITPNGVTAFRCALTIPVVVLILNSAYGWALTVFAISMLLDFVDGALAEARAEKTESGAFLDPLADKLIVVLTLGFLADTMPGGWLLCVAVAVVGFSLTAIRIQKMLSLSSLDERQRDIRARPAGKLKLITEVIALCFVLLGLSLLAPPLIWIGSLFMLIAVFLGVWSLFSQICR
ncbi:MAG: CDP-alcohol phosphatidyltransferase family protein [Patescibacteria group bacterium]